MPLSGLATEPSVDISGEKGRVNVRVRKKTRTVPTQLLSALKPVHRATG